MQCIITTLGKTYLIRNGDWIPVPEGSKLSDFPEPKVERKPVILPVTTEFQVKSSKPGKFYTVVRNGRHFSCDCQGYTYRSKCRHVDEIREKYD